MEENRTGSIILSIVISLILIVGGAVGLYYYLKNRNKTAEPTPAPQQEQVENPPTEEPKPKTDQDRREDEVPDLIPISGPAENASTSAKTPVAGPE